MRVRRGDSHGKDIPAKANHILNIILIAMALVVVRIWHLTAVQHQDKLEEALRPRKRIIIEPAKRGTIRDRFNDPLAINKIQYNASILYSQIREIPAVSWVKEGDKKTRRHRRREYIEELSHMLARELDIDPERVEDLIHAKASIYNNIPFVIKEDISERQFYRLKMLEKDWPGIFVGPVPKRVYPRGKVAADIIGYMGMIGRNEYEEVVQEIKFLENFLHNLPAGEDENLSAEISTVEGAKERLRELMDQAYAMNDYVGKTGVEGQFERYLRGRLGKKSYVSDARGNFLQLLPGVKEPLSGKRILLTISADLQEYAEKLLIEYERRRHIRVSKLRGREQKMVEDKHPWIKGGAIVAMDPSNGDILALASYPRFDPNDFISSGDEHMRRKKAENIGRWFELESYIAKIWDGRESLQREFYKRDGDLVLEEETPLYLEKYLAFILPLASPVKNALQGIATIKNACAVQSLTEKLLETTACDDIYAFFNLIYNGQTDIAYGRPLPALKEEELQEHIDNNRAEIQSVKRALDPFLRNINNNYDKVLLVDLCRLLVDAHLFSDTLLRAVGNRTIFQHRRAEQLFAEVQDLTLKVARDIFHELYFKPWRLANQREFIRQKRQEEKASGVKYARPYLDYLDEEEHKMFLVYWERRRFDLVKALITDKYEEREEDIAIFLAMFPKESAQKLRQELVAVPEEEIIPYLRTLRAFNDLTRPLLGRYRHLRKERGAHREKHLAAAFYPKYGFGYARSFAYRQAATQGSIFKIVTAYEALTQRYCRFGSANLNPLEIVDDFHAVGVINYVGYASDGRPIPQLYKGGRIPKSHRSGIGRIDIVKALEYSSNPYFSLLAADYIDDPDDLSKAALDFCYGDKTGIDLPYEIAGRVPNDLRYNRNGLYSMAVGQHSLVVTPLQTAVMLSALANGGRILKPKIARMIAGKEEAEGEAGNRLITCPTVIRREIFLPERVREILLRGMFRAQLRSYFGAMETLADIYGSDYRGLSGFKVLKKQIAGKSSTAEAVENIDLDRQLGTNTYNHIWFVGIVFDGEEKALLFRDAELVVVVYLRFGSWGKDAAPIAYQIVNKWREIKKSKAL